MFCRVAAPFHVHTSIAAGLQLLHNPAPRALFPGGLKAAVPVAVKQHLPGGFICIFLKPKGEACSYLLTLWMCPLVKCLFKCFAHV